MRTTQRRKRDKGTAGTGFLGQRVIGQLVEAVAILHHVYRWQRFCIDLIAFFDPASTKSSGDRPAIVNLKSPPDSSAETTFAGACGAVGAEPAGLR